jgi:hypothetical protein
MAAGAMQLLVWFAMLRTSGEADRDAFACANIRAMRWELGCCVTAWCHWFQQQQLAPAPQQPPPAPQQPPPPAPRVMQTRAAAGRPRRGRFGSLLVMLVSVLLVVFSLQGAVATPWQRAPTHPPVGGSFRPWPV